ncbi:MAG: hypothetical protein ACI8V2_003264 [Candidatus Latescibacterota bacterium]|jgi:hypothetical protein
MKLKRYEMAQSLRDVQQTLTTILENARQQNEFMVSSNISDALGAVTSESEKTKR